MDYYYPACLGGLVVLCAVLLFFQPTRRQQLEQQGVVCGDEHPESPWYEVYALAMAADWLQVSRHLYLSCLRIDRNTVFTRGFHTLGALSLLSL